MEQLFWQLARMGLYGSALVLVVLLLRVVLRRAPKRIICLLWALVAFRLVCPAQIQWRASLMPPPETIVQTVQEIPNIILPTQEAPAIPPEQPTPAAPAEPTSAAPDLTMVLSRVWLAGVIAMLLWAGFSDLRLRRRLRASVRMQNGVWLNDEIDTPFVLGLFSPRIYLPYGWDDEQNVYILAHERAHIVRGDNWWKLFGWVLLAVYWFHPLLWLAYVLFCRDLELACDEHAVRGLDREGRAAYSQALLDCSSPRRTAFTFPVAFGEIGVRPRVKAVLNYKKPAFWLVLAAVLALIAAAIFFLTDRPAAEEAETELVFREVADFPAQLDVESSKDLTNAEVQSILTGPDAALVLDSKRTDDLYAHALFSGDQTFSGVVLGRQNMSRHGSYVVLKEEIKIIPGAVPINGEAFQQTCTVRGTSVDAQRWQNDGDTWFTTDFVRRDSDGKAYAVQVSVLCVPREGDTERDCIRRLYEIVGSFLNPDNKISLGQIRDNVWVESLQQADAETLIEAFAASDGAETEMVLRRLAEFANEDYDRVMALIDRSTLTDQQKADLRAGIENERAVDDALRLAWLHPDANGVVDVPAFDLRLTLPKEWTDRVVVVSDRFYDSCWLYVANAKLIDAYADWMGVEKAIQTYAWQDRIFLVYAVNKQAHPDPADDFSPDSTLRRTLIGETDRTRIYAWAEHDLEGETFMIIRSQLIDDIGQARYEALVGDLTVDEGQLRDYVHVREGAAP